MNSFAFILMLACYALVLGWYVLNHERDRDGQDGFLGVRTKDEDSDRLGDRSPGYVLRAIRGGKVIADKEAGLVFASPAERIRARAPKAEASVARSGRGPRAEQGAADAD